MLYPLVIDVKPLSDYCVQVTYKTGEVRIFSVKPYIFGDWFGKLADERYFKTVRPARRTIEWADGQDIAPHELYDDSVPA